jgi:hypothetical protein
VAPRRQRPEAPTAVARPKRRGRTAVARLGVLAAAITAGVALVGSRGGSTPAPAAQAQQDVSAALAPARTTATPAADLGAEAASARKLAQNYRRAEAQRAKQPGVGARDPQSVALGGTAQAYERAASAATRGDVAGYNAALAEAAVKAQAITDTADVPVTGAAAPTRSQKSPRPAVTAPTVTAPAAVAPAPSTPPAAGCAGDSASDDPSDDECSP